MAIEKQTDPFSRLLRFLDQLEAVQLSYDLKHERDSIMIQVYLPTGMWEIEFMADGTLEVELFPRTEQGVHGVPEEWLDQFIHDSEDE